MIPRKKQVAWDCQLDLRDWLVGGSGGCPFLGSGGLTTEDEEGREGPALEGHLGGWRWGRRRESEVRSEEKRKVRGEVERDEVGGRQGQAWEISWGRFG